MPFDRLKKGYVMRSEISLKSQASISEADSKGKRDLSSTNSILLFPTAGLYCISETFYCISETFYLVNPRASSVPKTLTSFN